LTPNSAAALAGNSKIIRRRRRHSKSADVEIGAAARVGGGVGDHVRFIFFRQYPGGRLREVVARPSDYVMYGRSAVCHRHSPPSNRSPNVDGCRLFFRFFAVVTTPIFRHQSFPARNSAVVISILIALSGFFITLSSASTEQETEILIADDFQQFDVGIVEHRRRSVGSEDLTNVSSATFNRQPFSPAMTSSTTWNVQPMRHRHTFSALTSLFDKRKSRRSHRRVVAPTNQQLPELHRHRRHRLTTSTAASRDDDADNGRHAEMSSVDLFATAATSVADGRRRSVENRRRNHEHRHHPATAVQQSPILDDDDSQSTKTVHREREQVGPVAESDGSDTQTVVQLGSLPPSARRLPFDNAISAPAKYTTSRQQDAAAGGNRHEPAYVVVDDIKVAHSSSGSTNVHSKQSFKSAETSTGETPELHSVSVPAACGFNSASLSSSTRFLFCNHRFVYHSVNWHVPDERRHRQTGSDPLATDSFGTPEFDGFLQQLVELEEKDCEAEEMFRTFCQVLENFDCQDKYSMAWDCSHCKVSEYG
jgi:hypothetical protein